MARAIGIRIHKGADLIDTQVFERDIIKIGRLASAHLRLEDSKVSRIHAVIDIANGNEVSVIDMGSAEGTRVNGERVSRVRLKHGDEVGLGESRLVMVLDEAALAELRGSAAPGVGPTAAVAMAASSAPVSVSAAALGANASPFDGGMLSETGVFSASTVSQLRTHSASLAGPPPPVADFAIPRDSAAEDLAPPMFPDPPRPVPFRSSPPQALGPRPGEGAASQPSIPPGSSPAPRPSFPPGPVHPSTPPLIVPMQPLPPIPEDAITPENRHVEVTLRWGSDVVECKRVRNVPRVVIGMVEADAKSDAKAPAFFLPLEGAASGTTFDLLRSSPGGGWVVRYTSEMSGNLRRGNASVPLAQADGTPDDDGFALPLTDDTQVSVAIGAFTLDVRVVPKSRIIPIAPIFDVLWANTAVITMFTTIAMLALFTLMPSGLESMEDDLLTNPLKFQTLILKPPPKDNSFLNKLKGPKEQKQAAKNDQGKAGDKRKKEETTDRMAVKAREKPTDEQVVASKLDALFGDNASGGIAQLFGENTGGSELEAALGGIDGAKVGASGGSGSLGLRGGGPGGGGAGLNTLGTGKVGTRGRGSGDGTYGAGGGGLGGKTDRDAAFTQGTPQIYGSLDKEIIRRIVQEHGSQIRYCYERELTRTPGLQGKVKMKWIINGEGKVTQSSTEETQMNNANVENCLATKIKTWVFPKPKGGGIVIVSYPFVFKQGG